MGEGEEKERIRVCKEGELSHDPLSYDTSNQSLTFLCINFSNVLSRKFQSSFIFITFNCISSAGIWGPSVSNGPMTDLSSLTNQNRILSFLPSC